MSRSLVVGLAFVWGCSGTSKDQGTVPGTDDAPTDATDTGTPTTDTEDTEPPTHETGTVTTVDVTFSDLAWELHPVYGSLAVVSWTQDVAANVHVEYSVDPGEWLWTPTETYGAGRATRVVAGIPYATDAEWRVVADGGASADGPTLTTGELPRGMPIPALTIDEPTRYDVDADRWYLGSINARDGGWTGGTYWTFVLDRKARIVWAQAAPDSHWTLFVTPARSGDHFLWDESTYWSNFGNGEDGSIHRAYLDREIEEIPTPGLHHEWIELPDGTLVYGSQAHGGGESLVEKAPGQADETVLWDCRSDWPNSLDWRNDCESNGIFWVESTDTFLYSFYTNNSIVEVDHATGASLWWAGDVPNGYDFVPADSQYAWQHGISYTDAGTLLVTSEWDGGVRGNPTHTWLLEYDVDPIAETLSLVWASDSGVRAETNGQAWRLPNGNTLHVVGSASVVREVDTAVDEDVWRVEFESDRLLGAGQFVRDLHAFLSP